LLGEKTFAVSSLGPAREHGNLKGHGSVGGGKADRHALRACDDTTLWSQELMKHEATYVVFGKRASGAKSLRLFAVLPNLTVCFCFGIKLPGRLACQR